MTYIIAEAALSHMGRMDYAIQLIDDAVDAGCNCVKFQVYKTDELIDIRRDPARYGEFKERELPYEAFAILKGYCKDRKIDFLATPHTVSAFEFLEELGVKQYKVGSGDRGEILELALKTGKKTYVSTGMRDSKQLTDLMLERFEYRNMVFMHCITQYPVTAENVNLGVLNYFKRCFGEYVPSKYGYSDHFPGTYACELAVAMGASVIEKHIRLPESEGQDNSCALNAEELKELVRKIRKIEVMIGSEERIYSQAERENESWALKGKNGKRPYS